jgi:hypothetical protein
MLPGGRVVDPNYFSRKREETCLGKYRGSSYTRVGNDRLDLNIEEADTISKE